MGTIAYGKGAENPFLGRDINGGTASTYSDSTGELLDREVRRIVTEGYNTARTLLETNEEQLEALSLALLDFETLDGDEINVAIEGGDVGEHRARKEQEFEEAMASGERARRAAAAEPEPEPPGPVPDSGTAEGMA